MDTSEKSVKDVDGKNKQEMEEVKPSSDKIYSAKDDKKVEVPEANLPNSDDAEKEDDAKVVASIRQHKANMADTVENSKGTKEAPGNHETIASTIAKEDTDMENAAKTTAKTMDLEENNDGKVVDSIPQHKANTADTENNEDILPVLENNDGKVVDSVPQHKANTADTDNNEDILPIPDILQDIAPSAAGASHEAELALDMEGNFQDSAQGAQTAFSEPEEKVDVEGNVGETKTDQVGIDAVEDVYPDSDEDVFDKEALTLKSSATAVSPGLN